MAHQKRFKYGSCFLLCQCAQIVISVDKEVKDLISLRSRFLSAKLHAQWLSVLCVHMNQEKSETENRFDFQTIYFILRTHPENIGK